MSELRDELARRLWHLTVTNAAEAPSSFHVVADEVIRCMRWAQLGVDCDCLQQGGYDLALDAVAVRDFPALTLPPEGWAP